MKGQYLDRLLKSPQTLFSVKDMSLLWGESDSTALRVRIHYYLKQGRLLRVRQGLYAKDEKYNPLELGTKIMTPAYISFETVLAKAGLIFQYYQTIFVASYATKSIQVNPYQFEFKKIKNSILMNPEGIEYQQTVPTATLERAVLDTLYLNKDYWLDNFSGIDWEKAFVLLPIYQNKRMEKIMYRWYEQYKAEKL